MSAAPCKYLEIEYMYVDNMYLILKLQKDRNSHAQPSQICIIRKNKLHLVKELWLEFR